MCETVDPESVTAERTTLSFSGVIYTLQFSLMATFPENILGILLFCGCVMVIGVIQVRNLNVRLSSFGKSAALFSFLTSLNHLSALRCWAAEACGCRAVCVRCNPVCLVSVVGDCVVRLQPPLPPE